MAKIQNPQNEKGQKLASEDYVNESLNASINKFDNTIKNIKGDVEQGLIDVTTEWNEDGHYYETIIAATDNIATKSLFDKQLDNNKYYDAGICIEIGGSLNNLQISPKVEASEYKWQAGIENDERGLPVSWNSSYYRTVASIASVHCGLDYVYTLLADKIDNLNVSSDCLQEIKISNDSSGFLTISGKDSDNTQTLGLNVSSEYLDLIYDPDKDGDYLKWISSIENKIPTAWVVAEAFTNHETFRKNSTDGSSYEIHVDPDKAKAWDTSTQSIDTHVKDNSVHITSSEKGLINSALQGDDIASEIDDANNSKLVTVEKLRGYVNDLNDNTFTIAAGSNIDIVGDSTKTISVKTNTDETLSTSDSLPTGPTIKSAISAAIVAHNTDKGHVTAEDKNKIDNYKSIIDTVFNEYGSYNISDDEKENYIIFDNWRNPAYISFANKVINGEKLFSHYGWKKFHIKEFNSLTTAGRMFENNKYLESFRCNMPALQNMQEMFVNCNNLKYVEGDFSNLLSDSIAADHIFDGCNKLKFIKLLINDLTAAQKLVEHLSEVLIDENIINENIKNKKLFLNHNEEDLGEALNELINNGWEYNKIESL